MSKVPDFKQYYAKASDMDSQQRKFYEHWLKSWQKNKPVDVDGNISYLFCYLYSVLERGAEREPSKTTYSNQNISISFSFQSLPRISEKGAEKILPELIRLKAAYSNEEQFASYCSRWISDCFVLLERFNDAVEAYPKLSPDARSSYRTDSLLSLKFLTKGRISGRDILTLCGPNVTSFGKKHLDKVMQYVDIILEARERQTGKNFLMEWAKDSQQHPYSVFGGSYYSTTVDISAYDFSLNEKATDFVKQLTREAENTVREEVGIPKVGEGWVAETELYYEIKNAFPNLQVQQHARPEWLHNQHLDIYIPELAIAIEYQGIQHETPVEYFGGEQALDHRQRLDARKRRRCKSNGVYLIYVYPGYVLRDILEQIRSAKLHLLRK